MVRAAGACGQFSLCCPASRRILCELVIVGDPVTRGERCSAQESVSIATSGAGLTNSDTEEREQSQESWGGGTAGIKGSEMF